MIWLTWRQFRVQASVAVAALAVLAVVFAVTGPHLAHMDDTSASASSFLTQVNADSTYTTLYLLGIGVLFLAPAIIGIFWGAPLITRELEAGTFRLAWNQSVTRTRWLAVKLGFLGLASMVTAGLLSLMLTWWASPIDRAAGLVSGHGGTLSLNRFAPVLFATRGITPIGYAAFAFALGVSVGVLIRHSIPAMATTLAVFVGVQIAMADWVRAHLIPPLHATSAFNPAAIDFFWQNGRQMSVTTAVHMPGAWVISNQTINAAGHVFTGPATPACLGHKGPQACAASLGKLHLRQLITYQPASRYWAFQWYETAIFLALAMALAGFCFWRIRRRLS
jgi:ABC-type transport system involved in multi-copper enzyme maturation permease subunit